MKMVDMAYTAKEKKEREKGMKECTPYSGLDYPYGLQIRLEKDHLAKLGMDKLPKVGKTLTVEAKCVVTSVSQNSSSRGSESRCVELQIQKLAVGSEPSSMEDAVSEAVDKA